MALSNWDTLAFDTEGKPGTGTLSASNGSSVSIYKNSIHVDDPSVNKNSPIATIDHGSLSVAGFQIEAERHPEQQAVFVYASQTEYAADYKTSTTTHMAGIGCYGFISTLEWLKINHTDIYSSIDPKYLDPVNDYMICSYYGSGDNNWGLSFYGPVGSGDRFELPMTIPRPDLDALWIGVTKETATAFFVWLQSHADEKFFASIDQSSSLRFNQGNAYFTTHLGTDLGATAPGEPSPLVMNEIVSSMKDTSLNIQSPEPAPSDSSSD